MHSESIVSASEGTCNHSLHILNLSIDNIVLLVLWAWIARVVLQRRHLQNYWLTRKWAQ